MQTDWVFVLDADEELDGDAGKKIVRLLESSNAGDTSPDPQLHSDRDWARMGPDRRG